MFPLDNHSNRQRPSFLKASGQLLICACLLISHHVQADVNDPLLETTPFVTEGYVQLEAGQPEIALESFSKALESNATDLSALLGRAMIYAEQQKHDQAFTSYDLIIQNYPRHMHAWNGRGLAAFNLEDFDEALNSFQHATADKPVNGFYYETLAWTRMCRGEFTEAAASAKTASLMYDRVGETSIYPLLIAYFAYLETDDLVSAERTLNYATKNRNINQWPSPVIDYLSGKISADGLISYVMDTAQETEAQTYIGLKLRHDNQPEQAEKHLNWVSQNGDPRVFEYTLARAFKMRNSVAVLDSKSVL